MITLLRTDQYESLESFSQVGQFVPLEYDQHGRVLREVARASFALPLPDQAGQFLPLCVALIRDLRRHVPAVQSEEGSEENDKRFTWWREDWTAQPSPASPTTAKLVPIVTTAPTMDAVELAQTYIRRWPVQENIIRDFLLPLGLDTNHGYGKTPISIPKWPRSVPPWRRSSPMPNGGRQEPKSAPARLACSTIGFGSKRRSMETNGIVNSMPIRMLCESKG